MDGGLQQWLHIMIYMLTVLRTEGFFVGITYVQSAVAKGGVCLDGSPPAYHLDRGSGEGINNWLLHIEGGGWCNNATTCLARRDNRLGSSKKMVTQLAFSGMLSNKPQFNPDFYNWNRVKVRYCDGSSFTGDVEAVNPATKVYYRGARVFVAVIQDLLEKGMKSADNAVLSGCSAGGLTSILHCYQLLLGSAKNLPRACTSKMKPGLCFFPQNAAKELQTPLFIINAAYDSWQETWLRTDSPKLNNKTIAKAVGDWFYDRSPFQKIDCPYPCDKTCHNRIFDPQEQPFV